MFEALIISCSERKRTISDPEPAILVDDGPLIRILRQNLCNF